MAHSFNPGWHGNATVLSVRVVELRMSLLTAENIEGVALKRTMPFLFSVDPNVVRRIKLYFFAFFSTTKYFLLLSTIKTY